MGALTFGLVAGFVITALPFLLSKAGITVDHIATVSAVAMSPTFWGFLLTPVIDVGFTRRTYAFVCAVASVACLGTALWLFSPGRLWLFTLLVLCAELTIVLQSAAVNGWTSEFVCDGQRGKVAGWINAANLGGGALGAMLLMWLAAWLPFWGLAIVIAFTALVSSSVLFTFPPPAQPQFGLRQILGGTFRSVVETCRQPQVLSGFMLFLAPASCVAAINLFAGLGKEFHTSPQSVLWVTCAGAATTSALGSILGGYIADRMDRGILYLSGGIVAGLCALLMASTPHTQAAFMLGVLAYNGVAGVCYAAFSALGLQLTGVGNPTASTQLALFAAASNGAIVYMTWLDGQGFRMSGVRGLLLVDGVGAIGAAVPLILFLRWRATKNSPAREALDALPEEA